MTDHADVLFSTVYRSVGFEDDALLINSINNAMGIVGQIICVLFLDKVGRRTPLVGGNIVAGSMFIGATYVPSPRPGTSDRVTSIDPMDADMSPSRLPTGPARAHRVLALWPVSIYTTFSFRGVSARSLGSSEFCPGRWVGSPQRHRDGH